MKINMLKFYKKDGVIVRTDTENEKYSGCHFTYVFNRDVEVYWDHVSEFEMKRIIWKIVDPLSFEEFYLAINKLVWHKSLGMNGVSPNTVKALDSKNKYILFTFIREWM